MTKILPEIPTAVGGVTVMAVALLQITILFEDVILVVSVTVAIDATRGTRFKLVEPIFVSIYRPDVMQTPKTKANSAHRDNTNQKLLS